MSHFTGAPPVSVHACFNAVEPKTPKAVLESQFAQVSEEAAPSLPVPV